MTTEDINYTWDVTAEAPTDIKEDFSFDVAFFDEKSQEDMMWQARTGLNMDTLCGAIETLIFMSDRPISIQKIKSQIDEELPLRVIHESISKLQADYETKHHGIRLAEVAEGFQFRTKATYSKFVQNLFKFNALVLTPTALEVLAIIAYKQPVSRTEIDKIRGVDSSHIIRALMDKRLVQITGRSEELGRPSLFGTTHEFLEVFNLKDISELPPEFELEELAMKNTVGQIADIKSVVFRGDREKFSSDNLEELDQLSAVISDIAADTDFTLMLKAEDKKKTTEGDDLPRRSAFDLLEDFVNREESVHANQEAMNSETPMTVIEPKVVDLSQEGVVFNAPEVDADFEFERAQQMLDTEKWENEDMMQEAIELQEALDMAFSKLTGDKLPEIPELEGDIDQELNNLDMSIDEAVLKGKDLDLDLAFLNELNEKADNNHNEA